MAQQGKAAVIEDTFLDAKSPKGSGANTPVRSRLQTPIASAVATPVASGAEEQGTAKPAIRKKKMTRNQMKAQEERRRLRKLRWLSDGGAKPEDTDSDVGP
jgi:elongation factor 3